MNAIWKTRMMNGLLEMTLEPSTATEEIREFNISILELCCSIFETIENIAKFRTNSLKGDGVVLLDYMVIKTELMNMICLTFSDRGLAHYIKPVINVTEDHKRIISIEKFTKPPQLFGEVLSVHEINSNTIKDETNKKFVEYVYHILTTAQQMSIKGF